MICQNCSAEFSEGQAFCGKCGFSKTTAETLASVSERIAKMEAQLADDSRRKVTQQNYFELETAANIMTRVKAWTTLILYFAGIPAAVALLALAVMFGKGAFDVHSITSDAKESVNAVLNQARTEASKAAATANDALNTSKQVNADIQGTQRRVLELKAEVNSRSAEVQKLNSQIKDSQTRVENLGIMVNSQSHQIARLSQQLKTTETQKNVASVREAYPNLFGEHVAGWRGGWIDPKAKPAGNTYVAFILAEYGKPSQLSADKIGECSAPR